jgi:prepilin-type N-terminal cleavage/methylation domain-containing protein
MTPPLRRRPGFTLIELLVVMWVMTIIMAMSISFILALLRTHETDGTVFRRIAAQTTLAERFRADVAAAEAAPPEAAEEHAGRDCLILRRPGGSLVVYRLVEGELQRSEGPEQQLLPLGSERATVEFERSGKDGRLITLRWVERRGLEGATVRHAQEFTAALGGDLR